MDITLTLKCNNNCVFCPRESYLKTIACGGMAEAVRDIGNTRRMSDKIVLSGGEVTLLSNLTGMLDFCRQKKFKEVSIITNGRKLKDRGFAQKLIQAGVTDFAVSVYSTDEKIHDRITRRRGSARETKKGLLNLLALSRLYPISVRVNIVLNYWNHRDLPVTLKELFALGARNFIIAEQVIIDKRSKYLSPQEIKSTLSAIKELNLEKARLVLRGFPFCFLGCGVSVSGEDFVIKAHDPFIILEKQEVNTLIKEKGAKNKYLANFRKLFVKVDKCRRCVFEKRCQGIQKAYL